MDLYTSQYLSVAVSPESLTGPRSLDSAQRGEYRGDSKGDARNRLSLKLRIDGVKEERKSAVR